MPAVQTPNPPPPPAHNQQTRETTHILDIIGDRTFWYSQREEATKKLEKINSQKEKLSKVPSEFVSELLFLQARHKEAESLKKKSKNKITARDAEAQEELFQLLGRYQKHFTPAASDDRMRNLEASMDKKIEEKTREHALKLKEEYQARESELVRRLDEETSRNQRLEERLEQLATQVNIMSNERSELTKEFSQLRETVDITMLNQIQEKLEGQEQRITDLKSLRETVEAQQQQMAISSSHQAQEETATQTQQTADLEELRTRVTSQEQQIAELRLREEASETSAQQSAGLEPLQVRVDYHEEQIRGLKSLRETVEAYRTMVKDVLGEIRLVNDRVSKHKTMIDDIGAKAISQPQLSSNGNELSPNTTDDTIRVQTLDMVEARLKQSDAEARKRFGFLSQQIGGMIDRERQGREDLEQWAKDSLSKQTASIDDINKSLEVAKTELDVVSQLANKLTSDIEALREALSESQKRLDTKTHENIKVFEDFGMRINHLSLWRDNFSTKDLARDMVNHIAFAIPQGMQEQVRHLAERINNVEIQIYNSVHEGSKKRKASNGIAIPSQVPVNGHPQTAPGTI
ncbi:hypothetical protein ACO1O0_004304 [Amphichorda felina]